MPTVDYNTVDVSGFNFIEQPQTSQEIKGAETPSPTTQSEETKPPEPVKEVQKPDNPKQDDVWKDPKDNKGYKFDGKEWIIEPTKIKLGETEYTEYELLEGLKSNKNKKDWQTENTKKAQELAEVRKLNEPIVDFVKSLKREPEILEAFKTFLEDSDKKTLFEKFNTILDDDKLKNWKSPYAEELETSKSEKEKLEIESAYKLEILDFKQKHQIGDLRVKEVEDYINKRFDENGVMMTLEDGFIILENEKTKQENERLKEELRNKITPNFANLPDKNKGAQTITAQTNIPKRVDDVILSEYKFIDKPG